MVENIKFKILPAGEGKTRWLVERAFEAANKGKEVFFVTRSYREYEKFVMYYRSQFAIFCPVKMAESIDEITSNAVILIDDIIDKGYMNLNYKELKECAGEIFATITGIVA